MITITQSVGRGGRAKRGSDVLKIQKLLNKAGAKPKLVPDSSIGRNTIRAIEQFQRSFMKRPDGRIDPDGNSLRRLNDKAAATAKTAATRIPFSFELEGKYIADFQKFDDPSKGYRGGGGGNAVLRDGYLHGESFVLERWYRSTVIDGMSDRSFSKNISVVRANEAGFIIRKIDFFDALPVSLTKSAIKITKFTFSFSFFKISSD